jgi:hypothetical protein
MGSNAPPVVGDQPVEAQLMGLLMGNYTLQMLATAVRMGIFDRLSDEPTPAHVLAELAGTLPDPTYRLMRALTVIGALIELPERRFTLGPLGKLLRKDAPCSFAPLALNNAAPWAAEVSWTLLHSMKTGESGFRSRFGKSLFEWLGEHPQDERLFSEAMSTFSGLEIGSILSSYDFSRHSSVVDVGGAHGELLEALLKAQPQMTGTLFDVPSVIERATTIARAAEVERRCSLIGGDFFESVPSGKDLYILKHILHDWDDERALRVLRSIERAMPHGASVLIAEQGIAPPGVPNPGKLLDVVMLSLLESGRERSAEDFASLLSQAGLELERAIPTPGPITLFLGSKR